MPQLVPIPDPPAGDGATGCIRVDTRDSLGPTSAPPLVFLGGMTQTLSSWGGQLRPMSATRRVVAYEARGQGKTVLSLTDVSLSQHADDFVALLDALGIDQPVDLAGFSFGGRVSLAAAARHPARIRRLIISGVGADRGALGRVIVRGWQAALATGDLHALARISLADTLGPAFLDRHETQLDDFVQATVTRNNYAGIKALFETNLIDRDPRWQPATLAEQIHSPVLLLGGRLDRIATPDDVAELASRFRRAQHDVFEDAGHTIAIEAAAAWRERVLRFLDAEIDA
ncbi:MAG: alpha/beta fold hydrolase [Myxococcales bacterium FL481]|nr:MAG: alpha/beta fold hydrolase [Myxococcales bacterium FL481]